MKKEVYFFCLFTALFFVFSVIPQGVQATDRQQLLLQIEILQQQLDYLIEKNNLNRNKVPSKDYYNDRLSNQPFDNSEYSKKVADLHIVADYRVDGSRMRLVSGGERRTHQELWSHFIKIAGEDFVRQYIDRFIVYSDRMAGDAFVEINKDGDWVFALYNDLLGDDEPLSLLDELFVHEYAHVLTLNYDEIDARSRHCNTYKLFEGCAMIGSYYKKFVDTFWTENDLYYVAGDFDKRKGKKLYQRSPDWFLNDYAAINEREDIAESYAHFVLYGRPSGRSMKGRKVQFFYAFPELVQDRTRIRGAL
jgi:hypothetical protein